MGKKIMTAALAVLLFTAVITAVASATTIWVPEGGNQTIQQAVDNATAGDTIIVRDGTYNENVDVDAAHLTIRSQNGSANCIVNASDSGDHVFDVQQDYVNISGFTVTNATGSWAAGINLQSRQHCDISDNTANSNTRGIVLVSSSDNTLTDNTANSNSYGIYVHSSSDNTLTNNTANSNSWYGIYLLSSSNNNTLTNNTANSNSWHGIYLYSSSNNNVSCNWVQNNSMRGFRLYDGSTGNTIENNNIIANGALQADGSYQYQFYNQQEDDVEVKHNFWGYGMNDTIINASIYDWQDNHNYGNVTFDNRNGPAPCAPIPELPTILLFGIGLVALAGYIRIGRKKDE